MQNHYPVPVTFRVFPFYVEETKFEASNLEVLFYDDMLEALNEPNRKPWQQAKIYLPDLFENWKQKKDQLIELYSRRDRKLANPIIVELIAQLIQIIHWMNEVPVKSLVQIDDKLLQLKYKPVNMNERLSFILKDPDHFHSYNQLKALYDEAEKLFYKALT
ncbi:YpoC family protein [Alkalihalobacterium elongatum]|uniref:YpoC family protein n=1 Tax=Alkalihalobacterium elongatum TaxID=2675466 RepID=UPI001C1FC2E3|nr:hypothetical protein [Alkalihalobacterium elongatum]